MTAAILDRLLHRSVTLNIQGESYRLHEHRRTSHAGSRTVFRPSSAALVPRRRTWSGVVGCRAEERIHYPSHPECLAVAVESLDAEELPILGRKLMRRVEGMG